MNLNNANLFYIKAQLSMFIHTPHREIDMR